MRPAAPEGLAGGAAKTPQTYRSSLTAAPGLPHVACSSRTRAPLGRQDQGCLAVGLEADRWACAGCRDRPGTRAKPGHP